MVTLAALVKRLPEVKIICSRPAAQALETAFPDWDEDLELGQARIQAIRPSQESLDLGQGHLLQLLTVPTPRWPDGLCTYDAATQILFSGKLFGAHVCEEALFDENWRQLESDRCYYFDCLYASQTKQVEAALDQFLPLPARCLALGHGSLVRYSLSRLQDWCQQQAHQTLQVALLYASAYGNTAVLANAIAQGLIQADVAVELINCESTDAAEMAERVSTCDGFIIGSPTLEFLFMQDSADKKAAKIGLLSIWCHIKCR